MLFIYSNLLINIVLIAIKLIILGYSKLFKWPVY